MNNFVKAKLVGLVGFLAVNASAKLGETPMEIKARYGPVVWVTNVAGFDFQSHKFRDVVITVSFFEGRCAAEYLQAPGESHWNESEAVALASAIAGSDKWERVPTILNAKWVSPMGVSALLEKGILASDTLMVMDRSAVDQMERFTKAKSDDLVRGFSLPVRSGGDEQIDKAQREALARQADLDKFLAESYAAQAKRTKVLEAQAKAAHLLKWHQEQAEKGMPFAQCSLGKRYLAGDGVPKDLTLARQWFEKAAAQGDPEAKAALAKLPPDPKSR